MKTEKKRNLIQEIIGIKTRSDFDSRHSYSNRLTEIENALKNNQNGDLDKELLKYIPIATVACFEAFFRSIYKELIDFGKPFSENVIEFNQSKNVKFDFDIINAIQTKTITVGEFISHLLPCNNFEDINTNLSILTKNDFTDQIKKFDKKSVFEPINEDSKKFKENYKVIIGYFAHHSASCFGHTVPPISGIIVPIIKNRSSSVSEFIVPILSPKVISEFIVPV
jgi:hypothetical protein